MTDAAPVVGPYEGRAGFLAVSGAVFEQEAWVCLIFAPLLTSHSPRATLT